MNRKPPLMDSLAPLEDRACAFHARFHRKGVRSLASRSKARHRGRRLVVLAAAVAVPAFAAPSGWDGFHAPVSAQTESAAITPLGFERAGESFPGSAFFYLADTPEPAEAKADLTPEAHWDSAQPPLPLARPIMVGGTATDQSRALQCMTMAIYYEAASESDAGQRAVAQVVLNRVAHPTYPDTVCGVVFQGSARKTGCQFTFTCDGSLARQPSRLAWDRARRIAQDMLHGGVYAPVGLATHYHTIEIHPYWASSLDRVGTIGAHHFYRWKGRAGQPAAFRFAHSGREPAAARLRQADDTGTADPVALAAAYEAQAARMVQASAPEGITAIAPTPAPSYSPEIRARGGDSLYSGDRLPSAGSVRPEYARSGQWIGPDS